MRKILFLTLVFPSAYAMFSLAPRVPLRMPTITNQRYAFNSHTQFGKTHFIVGYDHTKQNNNKQITSTIEKDNIQQPLSKKRKRSLSQTESLLDESRYTQAFFTSTHDVRSIIEALLSKAERKISVAAFALTDPATADLLINAHNKGIVVEVVTDFINMNEQYSKIQSLIEVQIPVFYYRAELNPNPKQKRSRYGRMHHKFLLIDDETAVNGSANFSRSGQKDNIENIVVIRDQETVRHFAQEFEHLKKHCKECKNLLH